jgi:hypothetical protein
LNQLRDGFATVIASELKRFNEALGKRGIPQIPF